MCPLGTVVCCHRGGVCTDAWARHRCLQLYLGPEHRWCEDPLESALFIIIIIIIIIIILLRNESHFWGPKHARKVMKLCTRIRPGENLHLIWFQKWVWQNSSIAPPIHFQRCAPRATFHVHAWKSVHSCNTPIPTKKSLEAKSQTQQEVGYF